MARSPSFLEKGFATTSPARLSKYTDSQGTVRDPYQMAIQKIRNNYSGPTDIVVSYVVSHFLECFPRSGVGELADLDSCLNGVAGKVSSLELTTSGGGFIYGGVWHKHSRSDYIYRDSDNLLQPHPKLLRVLKDFDDSGFARFDVANCLKDERVSVEKARIAKTKLFSIVPFPQLVYLRRYTVPLLLYFRDIRLESGVASGINPHSNDFHVLYEYLNSLPGATFVDGDYAGYEYAVPHSVTQGTYKWLASLFPPVHRDEFLQLSRKLTANRNFLGRYSYVRTTGNCSGQPLTLLFNCCANKILMYSNIFVICQERRLPFPDAKPKDILSFIDDNMRDVYFGDDHILSFSNKLSISGHDLADQFAKWNISYTTPQKDKNFIVKNSIQSTIFLKRRFWLNSEKLMVALLEPHVIFETLLWHRTQSVPQQECIDAVTRSMRDEIALYGNPAIRHFEKFLDYIYTYHFECSKPLYDYMSRSQEVGVYSTNSPGFYFKEFEEFYSRSKEYNAMLSYMNGVKL